jgi:hypothetical protein
MKSVVEPKEITYLRQTELQFCWRNIKTKQWQKWFGLLILCPNQPICTHWEDFSFLEPIWFWVPARSVSVVSWVSRGAELDVVFLLASKAETRCRGDIVAGELCWLAWNASALWSTGASSTSKYSRIVQQGVVFHIAVLTSMIVSGNTFDEESNATRCCFCCGTNGTIESCKGSWVLSDLGWTWVLLRLLKVEFNAWFEGSKTNACPLPERVSLPCFHIFASLVRKCDS